MRKILFILLMFCAWAGSAQVIGADLINFTAKTEVQMNAITVGQGLKEGSVCYRSDTDSLWRYDGSTWAEISGGSSLPAPDTTILVEDTVDDTKQGRIDVGNLATGTVGELRLSGPLNGFSANMSLLGQGSDNTSFYLWGQDKSTLFGSFGYSDGGHVSITNELTGESLRLLDSGGGRYTGDLTADSFVVSGGDGSGILLDDGTEATLSNFLQSGDNVSELVNDVPYLTSASLSNYLIKGANPINTDFSFRTLSGGSGFVGDNDTNTSSIYGGVTAVSVVRNYVGANLWAVDFESSTGLGVDYSLNSSGTPSADTDLITKGYADANYGGGGSSSDLDLTGNVLSLTNPTTPGNQVDLSTVPIVASALQSGDNVSELVNDVPYLTSVGNAGMASVNLTGGSTFTLDSSVYTPGDALLKYVITNAVGAASTLIIDTFSNEPFPSGTSFLLINDNDNDFTINPVSGVEIIGPNGDNLGDGVSYDVPANSTGILSVRSQDKWVYQYTGPNIGGGGTDDQTAAEVPNTPSGNIAATNVQAAINELDSEKVANTIAGRTGDPVSGVIIQNRTQYLADGDPASGEIAYCTNCDAIDGLTAGVTDIDFDGVGDKIYLDNRTNDVENFTISNMYPGFEFEIYLNQANEPSFTPSVSIEEDTLDWTTHSLGNTNVTLVVRMNGLGTIEGAYKKGN